MKAHRGTYGGRSHDGDWNPTEIGGARRARDPNRAEESKRNIVSGGQSGAVVMSGWRTEAELKGKRCKVGWGEGRAKNEAEGVEGQGSASGSEVQASGFGAHFQANLGSVWIRDDVHYRDG